MAMIITAAAKVSSGAAVAVIAAAFGVGLAAGLIIYFKIIRKR